MLARAALLTLTALLTALLTACAADENPMYPQAQQALRCDSDSGLQCLPRNLLSAARSDQIALAAGFRTRGER